VPFEVDFTLKSAALNRDWFRDKMIRMRNLTSIELCAGAGGQALGLEQAGFEHLALYEWDRHACQTLRKNRPEWNVQEADISEVHLSEYAGQVDLLAGGVPCPPFSRAGKQLGGDDERDLFPQALRLIAECKPRAVLLENVRGLLDAVFTEYREQIRQTLSAQGYVVTWRLLNSSDFGVPQLRPRALLVAIQRPWAHGFVWPTPDFFATPPTVGDTLYDLMVENGWHGADAWRRAANTIAPTVVGGSKKHGGPDLGPTRAKKAWAALGVDGHLIANASPEADFKGMPHLTVKMVARLQGFPDSWEITGAKTNAYRQVGNAFPPPVAFAIGQAIRDAIHSPKELS
jgi:DNA (cytosine-5)-methyltransferase 1